MIVVVGSINVDLVASVNALPRAGETVLSDSYCRLPGGKGANQALAARRAGAEVELVGNVGHDEHAAVALEELLRAGVGLDRITKSSKPTGIAMIVVDRSAENQIVVAAGANGTVSPSTLDDRLLESASLLVLQLEIEPEVSLRVAQRAQALGTPVLLNAAPARPLDEAMLRTLDYLVVNELELEAIANSLEIDPGEVERRLVALAANANLVAIATLGSRGAMVSSPSGELVRCPALRVDPIDTTGAGDAFVGAFATAIDAGRPIPRSLTEAVAAGSLACTKLGAQSGLPTRAEIDSVVGGLNPQVEHRT